MIIWLCTSGGTRNESLPGDWLLRVFTAGTAEIQVVVHRVLKSLLQLLDRRSLKGDHAWCVDPFSDACLREEPLHGGDCATVGLFLRMRAMEHRPDAIECDSNAQAGACLPTIDIAKRYRHPFSNWESCQCVRRACSQPTCRSRYGFRRLRLLRRRLEAIGAAHAIAASSGNIPGSGTEEAGVNV